VPLAVRRGWLPPVPQEHPCPLSHVAWCLPREPVLSFFVHAKLSGHKKSKSVLPYHEAPKASYSDYGILDGEDLSDIDSPSRRVSLRVNKAPRTHPTAVITLQAAHLVRC
jgi:hypothetical protein